jgi:branched-chain amino acid transport system permease protein
MQFVQQLINGLALGSVYALIAIGYTMVYGIVRLINFAHGDVYMVGAFTGFFAASLYGFPFIPALLSAMVVCAVLGILIEKIAYKPLRTSPRIVLLITAIGMSLLLENGFRVIFGPNPRPFPSLVGIKIFNYGSLQINSLQIAMLVVNIYAHQQCCIIIIRNRSHCLAYFCIIDNVS